MKDDVNDIFTYHPWDESKIAKGTIIRERLAEAFAVILEIVPDCPDRDSALRKIREAGMDCNSAITHDGKY